MYFIYLILCRDGSVYTGVTRNLDKRFSRHQGGSGSEYTKVHKVISIVYSERFSSLKEAVKREKQIKGWRREKKLNLIKYGKPMPG